MRLETAEAKLAEVHARVEQVALDGDDAAFDKVSAAKRACEDKHVALTAAAVLFRSLITARPLAFIEVRPPLCLTSGCMKLAWSPLQAVGVESIDENGGGPGVRLRKPPKPRR